jgi:hypothetical protein
MKLAVAVIEELIKETEERLTQIEERTEAKAFAATFGGGAAMTIYQIILRDRETQTVAGLFNEVSVARTLIAHAGSMGFRRLTPTNEDGAAPVRRPGSVIKSRRSPPRLNDLAQSPTPPRRDGRSLPC